MPFGFGNMTGGSSTTTPGPGAGNALVIGGKSGPQIPGSLVGMLMGRGPGGGGLLGGMGSMNIRKKRLGMQNQPLGPNPLSLNIYQQYPGFNPQMRGDQLGGMEKQQGAGQETLQRLSDATMRFRGFGGRSNGSGMGMGFGEGDPLKKMLMARYGGM